MYLKKYGNFYSNLSDTIFIPQRISKFRCFLTQRPGLRSKIVSYLFFIITLFFSTLSISTISYAWGDPEIVTKINSAFESIEDWILKFSSPAAAVAVGTGVFMRKFSFGDEEKIRTGKKLIKGSLFSYGFILAIDLILSAIKSLIG